MLPVGFEPTISASERSNSYALDRAASGTSNIKEVDMSYYGREISFLTNNVTIHFLYVKFRIKYFAATAIKILKIKIYEF